MTIFATRFFGGLSLLLFGLFLYRGPYSIFDLRLSTRSALLLDAALSFLFFAQHSGMVRGTFRRRLDRVIAPAYGGATYALASAGALFAVLLLWQPTSPPLLVLDGPWRGIARGVFVAGLSGLLWGVLALGSFDGFGIRPIRARLRGKPPRESPLLVRGPYRWVRHPLYSSVLLLLWGVPDWTADRLLLGVLWTAWIVVGTILEERDLLAAYGEPYVAYRRRVPMLVPWHPPKR